MLSVEYNFPSTMDKNETNLIEIKTTKCFFRKKRNKKEKNSQNVDYFHLHESHCLRKKYTNAKNIIILNIFVCSKTNEK